MHGKENPSLKIHILALGYFNQMSQSLIHSAIEMVEVTQAIQPIGILKDRTFHPLMDRKTGMGYGEIGRVLDRTSD